MPDAQADSQLESAELHIVVTRADGRVEDYGKVAEWRRSRNPLKRLFGAIVARPRKDAP